MELGDLEALRLGRLAVLEVRRLERRPLRDLTQHIVEKSEFPLHPNRRPSQRQHTKSSTE